MNRSNPHVWYVPGQPNIYATCNAEGVCDYSKDGADAVRARYPDAILTTLDDAMPLIEQAEAERYLSDVLPVSEAQYWEAFEQLPPVGFKQFSYNGARVELFRLMEATCSNIRAVYVSMGGAFYCLNARDTERPADIAERVLAHAGA